MAETDCVPGVAGLELRNDDGNYLFERSHRFAGIQPNSGFGDYSRLSCGVGDTQLGRGRFGLAYLRELATLDLDFVEQPHVLDRSIFRETRGRWRSDIGIAEMATEISVA